MKLNKTRGSASVLIVSVGILLAILAILAATSRVLGRTDKSGQSLFAYVGYYGWAGGSPIVQIVNVDGWDMLGVVGRRSTAFAKHIGVTTARLSEIIHGKRPVTMNSALRLERALGFSAESWMQMQMTVDKYGAIHGRSGKAVARIKPIARAS